MNRTFVALLLTIFLWGRAVFALEPNEILIIANEDSGQSLTIAQYYCAKRAVPTENVFTLPLGQGLGDTISRGDYDKRLAEPVRKKLSSREFAGRIKCLLTTYGIPIKVGRRGPLKGREGRLSQLRNLAEQRKGRLEELEKSSPAGSAAQKEKTERELALLQSEINLITGEETNASVDSELSMLLYGSYELHRWQPNRLKYKLPYWDSRMLMVCRLDGPGFKVAKGLIDKALSAEEEGLNGVAYIDSRGIADDKRPYSFGYFDRSLRDLAELIKTRTQIPVIEERTDVLFAAGACPRTAIYCGWYSLKNYINAFDFVDGAVGYHISSLEAIDLRDPNSSQWCPAMLKAGITATLGAVAEPYLHSFPEPNAFFAELLDGCCLVEAYYRTNPFNSWQLVLIGDPLYRPFRRP